MEFFSLVVLMLSVQAPAIQGSPIVLESSKLIELPVGATLQLNCSSSSMYIVDFKEIGQRWTIEEKIRYGIEQDGNPRVNYSHDGCLHNDNPNVQNTTCIKTLEMDIVESLHGKSFQCRARTRDLNQETYYSEGSYLHVRQHTIPSPTSVFSEMSSTSVNHNEMLTKVTTTIEPSPTSSDAPCPCSGSTGTKHSSFLTLATAAFILVVSYAL